jgi:transcriptional regulator with PAS, ATPase and Fis domain
LSKGQFWKYPEKAIFLNWSFLAEYITIQIGAIGLPALFEKANHGSLLLDEIEGVPLEIQQRMLRPLQEKTIVRMGDPLEIPIAVDFRLITTTKRNLEQEVRNGHFREDLFYRINVFIISVPPLRERMEDIPLLACQFISREPEVDFISDNALDMLMKCSWAGNVRQLENVIKSASVKARYAKRNFINIDDLSDELIAEIPHSNNILPDIDPLDSAYSLEEEAILRALADIVIKNKQQLDISTNDIRKAMIPYLPQAEIFSGQRISAILRKLKLIGEDNTKHTESGNVYTIPLAKIKPLIQHYNINL